VPKLVVLARALASNMLGALQVAASSGLAALYFALHWDTSQLLGALVAALFVASVDQVPHAPASRAHAVVVVLLPTSPWRRHNLPLEWPAYRDISRGSVVGRALSQPAPALECT